MYHKTAFMVLMMALLASAVWAQTKTSSVWRCGDFQTVSIVPLGDRPNHTYSIIKGKCTPTKPHEIGGIAVKGEEITLSGETTGNLARWNDVVIGTMANGDKYYAREQCTETLRGTSFEEQTLDTATCSRTYTGGTGKLKNLKGKETSKGKPGPEKGTEIWEAETEFQLPKL